MRDSKKLYCSECGTHIESEYYKCLDNCLQVNFFDTDEENCFCSKECFCEYMSLKLIDIDFGSKEEEKQFVQKIIQG